MIGPIDWAGIFPASLTMFDADGDLDEGATAAHIERLISDGAHGVVAGGSSGEFITLTEAERRRVIDIAVAAARGRVPVIAGTGYASTRATIELTAYAASAGAAGAIVILPYYLRPTEDEVMEHFRDVGREAPLPIMVYNNPANSGAPPLGVPQLRELYEAGHASAVKSTFPTVNQVHELRAEVDDGFRVFYGSFDAPLEGMAGGAHGWISGILNVATADAVALWNAMQASDLDLARSIWRRILPLKLLYTRQQLGPVSDLASYRTILRLRGFEGGHSRLPLRDLSRAQVVRLREILEPLGLVPGA